MLAGLAIVISFLLPRNRLSNPLMIRADAVAPSHENESCHDGRNVNALRNTQQNLSAKYAVGQK
jgi:hypothetical protein